jgi:hypothetical protein
MALRTTLALTGLALATALSNLALADDVKATNPQTIAKSYGRAGGLAGSDRVMGLTVGTQPVGVTYDRGIAERTNMSTDRAAETSLGVTYDEQIAERTNMQRGSPKSVVAQQPPRKSSN